MKILMFEESYEGADAVAVSEDVEALKALAELEEHGRRKKDRVYEWKDVRGDHVLYSTRPTHSYRWRITEVDVLRRLIPKETLTAFDPDFDTVFCRRCGGATADDPEPYAACTCP